MPVACETRAAAFSEMEIFPHEAFFSQDRERPTMLAKRSSCPRSGPRIDRRVARQVALVDFLIVQKKEQMQGREKKIGCKLEIVNLGLN